MEGTKPRTVSSLGMFDLLKGIGMLAIVFAHTAELYPLGTNDVTPFAFALFAYREALMAAFFIASGYGFRKRSIHKCIEQQLKTLLKPYLYTALATTVLHAFIHHAAFGSWDAAISESAKVLGGFLLGLPHTATYFGQQFFSCGPMWYLVALMLAWVLLDVLLEIFPERHHALCDAERSLPHQRDAPAKQGDADDCGGYVPLREDLEQHVQKHPRQHQSH